MATKTKLPEGHDPFSIFEVESFDHIDKRLPSVALNISKAILNSNPIVKVGALSDGPLTALVLSGMWSFIYAVQKRMLALFINDAVNMAVHSPNLHQFIADFSCVAYSTAVSKALHNDEKKSGGVIIGAIWNKIWGGDSIVDSIDAERRKNFELVPPMTTSIVHVFLLNLKLVDDSISDKECERLLKKYDFSSFRQINTPFSAKLEFLGRRTMPNLLIERLGALQSHLSYLRKLSTGDYFIDLMDHYEKKASNVPERYLYGQF